MMWQDEGVSCMIYS